MVLIDGKETSKLVRERLAVEVAEAVSAGKKVPHLAAVLVGEDGASQTYVNAKVKACLSVGFKSTLVKQPANITQAELLNIISDLNNNDDIDGFIVQLPLPKHINENTIIEAIDAEKDVDGFHPVNVGKVRLGLKGFLPATPYGIIQLLENYNIPTEGKHCVVIGRSNIVGNPMCTLLSRKAKTGNCTVTQLHSRSQNIESFTKSADIIVTALGIPGFLKEDMVKEGAVVIDVGITRVEDSSKKNGYRLSGDVDFANVAPKCSFITPVPGGVGPMTIASLLKNTMIAALNK